MKNLKVEFMNDIDLSILDETFYLSILNEILESKVVCDGLQKS